MPRRPSFPIALTIAGSDSGGGAGIQADLKTFLALGVHGTCAITCLTSQNPRHVLAIQATRVEVVRSQLEAVFAELPPAALKVGMLYFGPIIEKVASFLSSHRGPGVVVDPILVSTSGVPLLRPRALRILTTRLLPLASLVMPNLPEAELLSGMRLRSVEDLRRAARAIRGRFGCAVLVKGGHLGGGKEAVDIFLDAAQELLLSAPFIRGLRTHGTGCAYSAAVVACLARGMPLAGAVVEAKKYISQAIAGSRPVGAYWALDHLGQRF